MTAEKQVDLVEQLRFLRRTAKFRFAKDQFYMVGQVMHEAADEIERLRNQLAQCRAEYSACIATVDRLENGSPADVPARRGDPNGIAGKAGHYWTCAKCHYLNDASIRFNRCGGCNEFQQGSAGTRPAPNNSAGE